MKPLSIYVHIPFCKSKCIYCDFNSFVGRLEQADEYIEKVVEEIQYYGKKSEEYFVKTIYFGGGTPSVIEYRLIEIILKAIKESYDCSQLSEVTIEANPGTVNDEKLMAYRKMGINRISFGIQSFDENLLKFLGRAHTKAQAVDAVKSAQKCGFTNISVDLIFSLPNQSLEMIEKDLELVKSLSVQHISTYSLKVEEGTPLYQMVDDGIVETVSEERDREHWNLIKSGLESLGFSQYEISNFSKENFESKHNSTYWIMEDYLGFGLGASSFYKGTRFSNIGDFDKYIQIPVEQLTHNHEELRPDDLIFESIMLGLRLNSGIDLKHLSDQYDRDLKIEFEEVIARLNSYGLIDLKGDRLLLTDRGRDLSNQVFVEFLNEM